ncbi:hypothetical protein F5I97DRAFT_1860186, partial [Phlebopus sp. FC_14]
MVAASMSVMRRISGNLRPSSARSPASAQISSLLVWQMGGFDNLFMSFSDKIQYLFQTSPKFCLVYHHWLTFDAWTCGMLPMLFPSSSQPTLCPLLEDLLLSGSITGMATVTSLIQSDLLQKVSYAANTDPSDLEASMLLTMLDSRPAWKISLRSISIEQRFQRSSCPVVSMSLFMFPNLHSLAVNHLDIILDDDILRDITSHPPHLEISYSHVVQISGLRALVEHCPTLSKFGVAHSDRRGNNPKGASHPLTASWNSQQIKTCFNLAICCKSPLCDAKAAASFLLSLFPGRSLRLDVIRNDCSPPPPPRPMDGGTAFCFSSPGNGGL